MTELNLRNQPRSAHRAAGDTKGQPSAQGIAIIGMSCIFPATPDVETFWSNIIGKVNAVGDPIDDWEAERYLDPKRPAYDRMSTQVGGFLKDLYRFDPTEFGIMPNSLDGGEPDQFLALKVASDALADAGYLGNGYDHSRTGIVLGHSTYLHRGQANAIQHGVILDQTVELLGTLFPHLTDDQRRDIRNCLKENLPNFNPDVAPGLVPNVMTGRIANRLDLQGPNYILDAACASSLLAVRASIDELLSGKCDLMLAGGVNASLPPEVSVIFSQLGALSPSSRVRPFDADANGTLLGEGLGVVVLKRLNDALNDGDRVYAVIRGVGSSSDGRGQGLLAPRLEGEILAIQRAYETTGVEPASIGLIEAHGTGIPLGDQTEITALTTVFGERNSVLPHIAIGSVKSQIAHCIPAAGIAGLIKTSLALYHKIMPPTLCDQVNPALGLDRGPFYVNTEPRSWIKDKSAPRRAAIEAFGFGGINCHCIVEEPPESAVPVISEPMPGGAELVVLSAPDRIALTGMVEVLLQFISVRDDVTVRDVAYTAWCREQERGGHPHRLAIVATGRDELVNKLERMHKRLQEGGRDQFATRTGSFYCCEPKAGELAFLFPGEGSQYTGMLATLVTRFPVVREWFDFWEGLYPERSGFKPSEVVFPPSTGVDPEQFKVLEQRLHDMDMGSEAVFIAAQALNALLDRLGVRADVMLGHSTGENSALVAAHAMKACDREEIGGLILALNRTYEAIRRAGKITTGTLMTVGAVRRDKVAALMEESGGQLHLAMDNCDNQLVLYGDVESIRKAATQLEAEGGLCSLLPFDRAYHTPLFKEVTKEFERYYDEIGLGIPKTPLYSCCSAQRFPRRKANVQSLAAAQWSSCVRFTETVKQMYSDGVRYFVEVGPSGNLTSFIDDILREEDYVAIQSNVRQKDDLVQLLHLLGNLYVQGRSVDLDYLYQGRPVAEHDWADASRPRMPSGIKLRNTLPVLRLSADQLSWLRTLLVSQFESHGPASRIEEPSAIDLTDEPAEAEVYADAQIETDAVMHRYLDMMQGFLEGHHEILQSAIGVSESDYVAEPFLDGILSEGQGWLEVQCTLQVETDRFLRHHVLSGPVSEYDPDLLGLAVVPLTVSLEMMAEAAHRLYGAGILNAIEDVCAYRWLALDYGETNVVLRAEQRNPAEPARIHVVIRESGAAVIEADYLFGDIPLPAAEPVGELDDIRPFRWRDDDLYAHGMFHGPLFQSVAHVRSWSPTGIDADLNPPVLDGFFVEGEKPDMVFNPVLLDALGQLSAYWISQEAGTDFNSFPSRIGRVEFGNTLPDPFSRLVARGRLHASHGEGRFYRFDYDCRDESGHVLIRARDWEDIFFNVPNTFYMARWRPQEGWLGQPLGILLGHEHETVSWWLHPLPEGLLDDSGEIFKRVLAHAILGSEERKHWFALPDNPRRRTEWLMGRVALKEVVRRWIADKTGRRLYPADIVIETDDYGRPYVTGEWEYDLIEAPEISLAHSGGYSFAAAGRTGMPVGVDMEWPGRVKEPQLVAEYFSPVEQTYLAHLASADFETGMLRIWCAKEAAAKCIGVGLDGRVDEFIVDVHGINESSVHVFYKNTQLRVHLGEYQGAFLSLASIMDDYSYHHAIQ